MIIELRTYVENEPDGFLLGRVDWRAVPRKGEYVVLDGLVCAAQRSKEHADRVQDRETFVVEDVVYECDLDGEWLRTDNEPVTKEVRVAVWLRINDLVWSGTAEGE